MATILTPASELTSLQCRLPQSKLLDVRLPEDFAAAHIPGAMNQCVFEVVFLDELASKGLAKNEPLCVYGASADSHESRVAAKKLERAGYAQVYDFRGGLDEWRKAGLPVEGGEGMDSSAKLADGPHSLDVEESKVEWIGRNLINKHWGQVALSGGSVEILDGLPRRGEAVLDMRRITCTDLEGHMLHDVLIHHLESDDFFDVERFPTTRFAFTGAERCTLAQGSRNLRLHGELTLRGVTRPLEIEAAAGITPDGRAALQAAFHLDRTEWGVIYGSGKFFRRLLGHLVNDDVEIQLRLLTVKG